MVAVPVAALLSIVVVVVKVRVIVMVVVLVMVFGVVAVVTGSRCFRRTLIKLRRMYSETVCGFFCGSDGKRFVKRVIKNTIRRVLIKPI